MHKHVLRILILILFASLTCCKQNVKNPENKRILNDDIYSGYDFLDSTMVDLKTAFEKGLESNKKRPLKDQYEMHAHGLKWDKLNEVPSTSSFPYNSQFSINNTQLDLGKSDVLVFNCGYQIENNDTIQEYKHFCLNNKSDYFQFLSKLGSESLLIKNYAELYSESKAITPNMVEMMALKAEDELNFSDKDHQLFYALHHIVFNEDQKLIKFISQRKK